jgi:hypothetical protein
MPKTYICIIIEDVKTKNKTPFTDLRELIIILFKYFPQELVEE